MTILLLIAMSMALAGCIQRRITITSSPTGALVRLNDEEIGRTPVTVPFTFYGVYDVRLSRDGYLPLWTSQEAKAEWWEAPGPDLFAELISSKVVELKWHFDMEPAPLTEEQELLERAHQMQTSVAQTDTAAAMSEVRTTPTPSSAD